MRICVCHLLLRTAAVWLALAAVPTFADLPAQPVTVRLADDVRGADLPPLFLGLSREMSSLLPRNGRYYFDPADKPLVQAFRILGVKSLRVGAYAVDKPGLAVPQEKEIDQFFTFARAAGLKVIYSFRLRSGDPAESARLAAYIAAHYADSLDYFALGNEPNTYFQSYAEFFPQWKAHYDAILQAVPTARIEGPSNSGHEEFVLNLVKGVFPEGHLKMVSDHYYFVGIGPRVAKNLVAAQ